MPLDLTARRFGYTARLELSTGQIGDVFEVLGLARSLEGVGSLSVDVTSAPQLLTLENLQTTLIKQGLAFVIAIPPNLWNNHCYRQIELNARKKHKGVWGNKYFQTLRADEINSNTLGFRLVKGKISEITESRHAIWLKMGKQFAIKIKRTGLNNFDPPPQTLRDKVVTVRGWISRKNRQNFMTLRHHLDLEISS